MNFFKPENQQKQQETPKYEELIDERKKIKNDIQKTLEGLQLNPKEIKEVLKIVDETEKTIEFLKKQLIGSNINQDPRELQKMIFGIINQNRQEMTVKMKAKVEEILAKKKNRWQ